MKTVAMKTVEVDNWSYLIGDGHKKTDARVGAREDSDLAFLWQQNLADYSRICCLYQNSSSTSGWYAIAAGVFDFSVRR